MHLQNAHLGSQAIELRRGLHLTPFAQQGCRLHGCGLLPFIGLRRAHIFQAHIQAPKVALRRQGVQHGTHAH